MALNQVCQQVLQKYGTSLPTATALQSMRPYILVQIHT